MITKVLKNDCRLQEFSSDKLYSSIKASADDTLFDKQYFTDDETIASYVSEIMNNLNNLTESDEVSSSDISQEVYRVLLSHNEYSTANNYHNYANSRYNNRLKSTKIIKSIKDILFSDAKDNNNKRENANIDGDTAMGNMLRVGSTISKEFYKLYMIKPEIAEAHQSGDIHIHDLDFYSLTETCCQIDAKSLFKGGFSTGHGYLREPNSVMTAGLLSCIAIQSDQNDQHGGQSIPNFDFSIAPYVAKEFIKQLDTILECRSYSSDTRTYIHNSLVEYLNNHESILDEDGQDYVRRVISEFILADDSVDCILSLSISRTDRATYQAMEAIIHNLNTMHSRAGAQVPFSSLNYGTDTSPEGRMVIKNILLATDAGLGDGETPVFPIQIFKMKSGVNYNPEDPNYDLFKLSFKVSAKRLFPNYSNLDAPFNAQYYKPNHPETEVAYMGCRTRVMGNIYDPSNETTYGRGNLSFTSINLPRIGIKSNGDWMVFFTILRSEMELVFEQLDDRFEIQKHKKVKNYPFLMGQGIWVGSNNLGYDDEVGEILKNGSLTVGFIGLAECLVAMMGVHHGESEEAQSKGLEIIKFMRDQCDKRSQKYQLNYTLIATPAEGLSGRFVAIDKKKFRIIKGVTDREYYTNSFHVPVYYNTSIAHKLETEAPYHELTNGGHISYVELDGDPSKNLEAFEDIVRMAHDLGIGYFSINHSVDRCPVCGYVGIIDDECPRCGRHDGEGVPLEKLLELQRRYPNTKIPISKIHNSCCL